MMFDDEEELAPGIYLTKRKEKAVSSQGEVEVLPGVYMTKHKETAPDPAIQHKKELDFLNENPTDHYVYVQQQIQRITAAVAKLQYSNEEMMKMDSTDPDFIDAVAENIVIMSRQESYVADFKAKARALERQLGICTKESILADQLDKVVLEDDPVDGGVYL